MMQQISPASLDKRFLLLLLPPALTSDVQYHEGYAYGLLEYEHEHERSPAVVDREMTMLLDYAYYDIDLPWAVGFLHAWLTALAKDDQLLAAYARDQFTRFLPWQVGGYHASF
jgi:hypothetical protein